MKEAIRVKLKSRFKETPVNWWLLEGSLEITISLLMFIDRITRSSPMGECIRLNAVSPTLTTSPLEAKTLYEAIARVQGRTIQPRGSTMATMAKAVSTISIADRFF